MALGITQRRRRTRPPCSGTTSPTRSWYKDAYALLQSDGLAPREDSDSWISKAWKARAEAAARPRLPTPSSALNGSTCDVPSLELAVRA